MLGAAPQNRQGERSDKEKAWRAWRQRQALLQGGERVA